MGGVVTNRGDGVEGKGVADFFWMGDDGEGEEGAMCKEPDARDMRSKALLILRSSLKIGSLVKVELCPTKALAGVACLLRRVWLFFVGACVMTTHPGCSGKRGRPFGVPYKASLCAVHIAASVAVKKKTACQQRDMQLRLYPWLFSIYLPLFLPQIGVPSGISYLRVSVLYRR